MRTANMFYCQFRNTVVDFRDCVDALSNAGSIDDFSGPERFAAEQMYHLANAYIANYELLLEESGE